MDDSQGELMQYLGRIFLSIAVLHSPAFAQAKPTKTISPISLKKINQELQKAPLMASHLRQDFIRNLDKHPSLAYATGHSFYDTAVELVDDECHKINRKFQYDSKKYYSLTSVGNTKVLQDPIWFFSTLGDAVDVPSYDSCTFEHPCRQLTQDIVEVIYSNEVASPLFWFASGTYDFPSSTRKNNLFSQVIDLHNRSYIQGRTEDFLYAAYDEERPLIKGSIKWLDFFGHQITADGGVTNIRMETKDNLIEIINSRVNTNLYARGELLIENSDLSVVGSRDESSFNVNAKNAIVSNSKFTLESKYGINIYSSGDFPLGYDYIQNSILKAQGSYVDNYLGNDLDAFFVNLDLSIVGQGEDSGIVAINLDNSNLQLSSSRIKAEYRGESSSYDSKSVVAIVSRDSTLNLEESTLDIKGGDAQGLAIFSYAGNRQFIAKLIGTKINVDSDRDAFMMINDNYTLPSQIIFQGVQSSLAVSSPLRADLFYLVSSSTLEVENNSEPPSQCFVNGALQLCDQANQGKARFVVPLMREGYRAALIKLDSN